MNKKLTIFLQAVTILLGISVLAFMLWMPHLEGRNANATPFQIYFNDPFLAYVYLSSIAFFIGVYKTYKALGYAGQRNMVSNDMVKAVKTIRNCAIILVVLIFGTQVYLFTVMRSKEEDIAGGVGMTMSMILFSLVVAVIANVLQKKFQTKQIEEIK